ncbi:MAG: alpha/beta hydrolase [Planctomycetota bacterium]|jgi:predicted esterase
MKATRLQGPPHAGLAPLATGLLPEQAKALLVLVHGRGGDSESMVGLADAIGRDDLAIVAPRAAGRTWYPQSFLAPVEANEPGLSSGLSVLADIVSGAESAGIPSSRHVLLGFSQGACLTLEFAARHARRFGAVIGLTGGLVGPPGTPRLYPGSFDGTPVFLGSSDPDPHVPWSRVEETAEILERMCANVELRRYLGMPHTVNDEEIEAVRSIIGAVVQGRDRDNLAAAGS